MSPWNKHHSEYEKMVKEVDSFIDGLLKAARTKLRMPKDFNRICVCGMGGSGFSGDIIVNVLHASWDVQATAIKSTSIPKWVDNNTLVIASSHSGNTEETLLMYEQAKSKGCKIVVITGGGELRDRCLKDNNKLIELPSMMQPRSTVGYSIGYLANIVETAGGPKLRSELIKMIPTLRKFRDGAWMRNPDSLAKKIAERMRGSVPVIYATEPLSAAALRWKNQINENSKMIAFSGTVSELNHSEIVGWSCHASVLKCNPILLYEEDVSDINKSIVDELTEALRSSGLDPEVIAISGETLLEKSLKAIILGDYTSLFLASMNEVDPMNVETIRSFKQRFTMLLSHKRASSPKRKKRSEH